MFKNNRCPIVAYSRTGTRDRPFQRATMECAHSRPISKRVSHAVFFHWWHRDHFLYDWRKGPISPYYKIFLVLRGSDLINFLEYCRPILCKRGIILIISCQEGSLQRQQFWKALFFLAFLTYLNVLREQKSKIPKSNKFRENKIID